jgi:hypothetical protein
LSALGNERVDDPLFLKCLRVRLALDKFALFGVVNLWFIACGGGVSAAVGYPMNQVEESKFFEDY